MAAAGASQPNTWEIVEPVPLVASTGANPTPTQQSRVAQFITRHLPWLNLVPLRTFLILVIIFTTGTGLIASAYAVNRIMHAYVYDRVDKQLDEAIHGWASRDDLTVLPLTPEERTKSRPPSQVFVEKISTDGSTLVWNDMSSSPNLSNVPTNVSGIYTVPTKQSASGYSGDWRVRVGTEEDGDIVVVARPLENENKIISQLAYAQVIISILALLGVGAFGWWMINQLLRPLREVERTAEAITAGDLDRRLPNWAPTTEVGQVAGALNGMLERLQESIEDAQDKEQQMRRFVGDASHELRTPLTSVKGYAELYRQGAAPDPAWVISRIEAEASRMSLLVEDLLALTRAEGMQYERSQTDLLECAVGVCSALRVAHTGRNISINTLPGELPIVYVDAARMHQVITNLVNNALLHGGPEANVTVEVGCAGGRGVVRVIDDGVGMSEEDAKHIFERFYRADVSRSRASGGSGLGLAIVQSLVEAQGGTVTVKSKLGEGSTFEVSFPLYEPAEK